MKYGIFVLGGGIVSVFVFLAVVGAFFPFSEAPLALHTWLPTPVACAGYSCITYSQWSTAVRQSTAATRSPSEILTILTEQRALKTVARYEGARVSSAEIDQALDTVQTTLESTPGGTRVLDEVYGTAFDKTVRESLRVLILREKLVSMGISSPWDSQYAPRVTVWNVRLQWDPSERVISVKP